MRAGRINVIEANLATKDKAQSDAIVNTIKAQLGEHVHPRRADERLGICDDDAELGQ